MFSTLKCRHIYQLRKVQLLSISNKKYTLCSQNHTLHKDAYRINNHITRYLSSHNETPSHQLIVFKPITFKEQNNIENIGEELTGPLDVQKLKSLLVKFSTDKMVASVAEEEGITGAMFFQSLHSFKQFLTTSSSIPTELHILLYDLINNADGRHVHDLCSYFIKHAQQIFPHLSCMENLYHISDLTKPLDCYPEARSIRRKIIFHAGPTNSGKTYQAMQKFKKAKSGIYVGPLKMLAMEVFNKMNDDGTPCDLITGENRSYAVSEYAPSTHLASTVEMTTTHKEFDIAVIDEIQMMRDQQRGWAWTRAFLGVPAKEIHVCGEESAIDLVKNMSEQTGDEFEVIKYKRLTKLTLQDTALESLENIQPGDCIVCFSTRDIYLLKRKLESLGHDVAVIYGGLPPGAKSFQSKKFNDKNHKCKVMVATDAIGMGINLSIKRIIFSSLMRPKADENGTIELQQIPVSSALQIAGRAGRYGTDCQEGFVTTLYARDLPALKKLFYSSPPTLTKAGLHPHPDQIELFAYHLRNFDVGYLIDVFCKLCVIDSSSYFVCRMNDAKFLALLINHIPLDLRSKYIFCTAPINIRKPFLCSILAEFVLQYSKNIIIDYEWMERKLCWPFSVPEKLQELVRLEEIHDAFELYFWLSYRFEDVFPDRVILKVAQTELDEIIQEGLLNLSRKPILQKSKKEFIVENSKPRKDLPIVETLPENLTKWRCKI